MAERDLTARGNAETWSPGGDSRLHHSAPSQHVHTCTHAGCGATTNQRKADLVNEKGGLHVVSLHTTALEKSISAHWRDHWLWECSVRWTCSAFAQHRLGTGTNGDITIITINCNTHLKIFLKKTPCLSRIISTVVPGTAVV